jgi:hypothetical protein
MKRRPWILIGSLLLSSPVFAGRVIRVGEDGSVCTSDNGGSARCRSPAHASKQQRQPRRRPEYDLDRYCQTLIFYPIAPADRLASPRIVADIDPICHAMDR